MKYRWLGAVVLAVASVAALGPLMNHFDLSGMWRLRLDRDGAIAEARKLAKLHGVEAGDWNALCRATFALPRAYLERSQERRPNPLFTAAQYDVLLTQPGGRRWVRLGMTAEGRPLSFQQAFAPGQRKAPAQVTAAELLALYAGPFRRSFRAENEGVEQSGNRIDSWAWSAANQYEPSVRFEVVNELGSLRSAKLELRLPGDYAEWFQRNSRWQMSVLSVAATVAVTLVFVVAFPVFFRGLVRRRFPSQLLGPVYAFFLLMVLLAVMREVPQNQSFTAGETFSSWWVQIQTVLPGWFLLAAAPMVFYGAGRAMASDSDLLRWFSFEALVRRQVLIRPIGWALLGGVLSGCVLAVLPFSALLVGTMPAPRLLDVRDAVSAAPVLATFGNTLFSEAAMLMLIVWPFRHWWTRRWVGWVIYAVMGAVLAGALRELYDHWLGHDVVAGLAVALGLLCIYQVFDLLAVFVAHLVMGSVTLAVALSLQPAGMRVDALGVMSLPLGLLTLGGLLAWWGRPVDVAAEVARQKAELKEAGSDRDRLRAEFSVARQAQLGMLPVVAERVGETQLAASCHPARDVGGDLYDFFRCADGRYGICVADVSGKGVPASLYMALTKGVMAAASIEGAPIPQLMSTLNRHLLEFGKRKMFVTMALGYYDPETRVLEHARAGHNPVLVWKAAAAAGCYLKPRGVGLGLAAPAAFERTLQVERTALERDDIVVFYSDGIVEAMNLTQEQFGEERLMEAVKDSAGLSAEAVEKEISRRVRLFAGSAPVHDDETLFVLRVG